MTQIHLTERVYRWYLQRVCFASIIFYTTLTRDSASYLCLLSIMPLITVPYQNNRYDCAVFVCRYAYSLYVMRNLRFTLEDYNESPRFNTLIENGPAFQFDMPDIQRIREEMLTLIEKLSVTFLRMEEEKKKASRVSKRIRSK